MANDMCVRGVSMSTSTTWSVCGITTTHTRTHVVYLRGETNNTHKNTRTWRIMGWLRLVGSLKSYGSFAKEPYERDNILKTRLVILRSLRMVATPYVSAGSQHHTQKHSYALSQGMRVCARVCVIVISHTHTVWTHTRTPTHVITRCGMLDVSKHNNTHNNTHTHHTVW